MYYDAHRYVVFDFTKAEVGVNSRRDDGRWVMACCLGRKLNPKEIVHHMDGNRKNNHPLNLFLTDKAEHIRIHKPMKGYKFTDEQRKRLSESHMGQRAWNKGLKATVKHTDSTKENLRHVMKGRNITWGDKITEAKTKFWKEDIIAFIKNNPDCMIKDIKEYFGMRSATPIHRHGGLRKLKKEALNV